MKLKLVVLLLATLAMSAPAVAQGVKSKAVEVNKAKRHEAQVQEAAELLRSIADNEKSIADAAKQLAELDTQPFAAQPLSDPAAPKSIVAEARERLAKEKYEADVATAKELLQHKEHLAGTNALLAKRLAELENGADPTYAASWANSSTATYLTVTPTGVLPCGTAYDVSTSTSYYIHCDSFGTIVIGH